MVQSEERVENYCENTRKGNVQDNRDIKQCAGCQTDSESQSSHESHSQVNV